MKNQRNNQTNKIRKGDIQSTRQRIQYKHLLSSHWTTVNLEKQYVNYIRDLSKKQKP